MTDDDRPLDPAETLRIIEAQRSAAADRFEGNPAVYYAPWGVAWLVGFGLMALNDGVGGAEPIAPMPDWVPLTTLFALMGVALTITVVTAGRSAARLRGDSNRSAMMFGLSWPLAYFAIMPIARQVSDFLTEGYQRLLFGGLAVGLTGVLYVAGSAVWRDWNLFVLGTWIIVTNVVGVALGPDWYSLIVSLTGGGGLIAAGLLATWRRRRRRP